LQTKVKEDLINLTINGKNYLNAGGCSCCYYSNGIRWPRKKYTVMHGHRKAKLI